MINKIAKSTFFCVLVFILACAYAYSLPLQQLPRAIYWPAKPGIVKMKLYQGNTIAIIWYHTKGDSRCDMAELYYKEDGYFVKKRMGCQQADEMDAYIFEPHI
jgi:hypothetical protein